MTEADPFTPTQRKIVALLSDGLPHHRREIHALLPDDLGALSNIWAHITAIRKRLRPQGHDILCEYTKRRLCYRLVRLVTPVSDGSSQVPKV